jgi:magnesium transporter
VRELLKFEETSAGGMMNTDFIYVGEKSTREEVLAWIREKDVNLEELDTIFLIDEDAVFSGAVPVGRLLFAPADELMENLKSEPLLSVLPDADEKEVFELFDKYNLHSLAVVNEAGLPMGAIEVDDVVTRLRHR